MKPLFLLLLLLTGVHGQMDAQEAVSLDQRFQLHYNRWQSSQGAAAATTQASYDFSVGMPVLTYRLGALALTGSVDYDQLSGGGESTGALGINHYGLRATLFPYRPFHLSFDYSHSQGAAISGFERVTGNVYGLTLNYRGRTVQALEISLRSGVETQGSAQEDWSILKLVAHQNIQSTRLSLEATHQAFDAAELGQRWASNYLYASTDTILSRAWGLRSTLAASETAGMRGLNANLNLQGTFHDWSSVTSFSQDRFQGWASESRTTMLSQSLALTTKKFSVFSSLALSSMRADGGLLGGNRGTLLLGGAYNLGQGWRTSLDFSESFGSSSPGSQVSQDPLNPSTSRNIRTVHAGLSHGGTLPDIIGRTLFFLSERNFQRRVAEDYAPGYVPSELVAEMARRRFRQSGDFSFAGDFSHSQAEGFRGQSNNLRVLGQVRMNEGWTFQLVGDHKRDEGLSLEGTRLDSTAYNLTSSYHFGKYSSLMANMGYSKNHQTDLSGSSTNEPPLLSNPNLANGSNRFLALGLQSRLGGIPCGVQWTQYEDDWQKPTQAYTGFCMLNLRKINLRISYQSARGGDGYRNDRITVDLLRLFDTISFGGFRP